MRALLAVLLLAGCSTAHAVKVSDDDPRWDCPTMGNRVCGKSAPGWMRDGDARTGPVRVAR